MCWTQPPDRRSCWDGAGLPPMGTADGLPAGAQSSGEDGVPQLQAIAQGLLP